jgi:hypothetical protein
LLATVISFDDDAHRADQRQRLHLVNNRAA